MLIVRSLVVHVSLGRPPLRINVGAFCLVLLAFPAVSLIRIQSKLLCEAYRGHPIDYFASCFQLDCQMYVAYCGDRNHRAIVHSGSIVWMAS